MKKDKDKESKRIPIEEVQEGATYRTYVSDIIRIEKIDLEKEQIILYNISGVHRQWINPKHLFLIEKL